MYVDLKQRPQLTASAAALLAEELYGLSCTARPLPSERDQNFLLECGSGPGYVLKIANASERREALEFQNSALGHLSRRDSSILRPALCRTVDSREIAEARGANGEIHFVRLVSYVQGRLLAEFRPHAPALLTSLGRLFGRLDAALADFSHPAADRELQWDLRNAGSVIGRHKDRIEDARRRGIVEGFLHRFEREVVPALPSLRTGVIHNDGNDHNVLVNFRQDRPHPGVEAVGILDFGDMLRTCIVFEPAIVAAYALLGKPDPVTAAAQVLSGYHEVFPLTEPEIEILFTLIGIRLCASVVLSALQHGEEPDNPYLKVSEDQAWRALEKLQDVHPRLAHYTFRDACRLPPCPRSAGVVRWLSENRNRTAPILDHELKRNGILVLDLSVGSLEMGGMEIFEDQEAFTALLFSRMHDARAPVGVGVYDEARPFYTSDLFRVPGNDAAEWRTIHLGVDLFTEAGSPVFSPLDATVHSLRDNRGPLDYGPTIILEHEMDGEGRFYTLYGHLSRESLQDLRPGRPVARGDLIGRIGESAVNGGWPPHVHFQIITDLLDREGEYPGVAAPSRRRVWLSLSPDPNILLQIPLPPPPGLSRGEIRRLRRQHLGASLSLSYREPLHLVRGYMQHLYDESGQAYLDTVNNVAHVGHEHPRVVRAAREQMAVLNTNTRYLHERLVQYAQRLCDLLPEPLRVCFFVCSGSEANDLALRLARCHTGRHDVVAVEGGYHGNLTSLIEISSYKFEGPGGAGPPPHVHKVPLPDTYRGLYRSRDAESGQKYAGHVRAAVESPPGGVAAFICESVLSCAGQIVLPPGYLRHAYTHVRRAGGVCIADEVQVGFGRVGSHFWAFETQEVVPDILTLGKPIGNGHPLAAVVTTPEIAASFDNGMEYFNTYGGNPVSCAVGMAVLDVIGEEALQSRARRVGARLKSGLEDLTRRHAVVGHVRGMGLFLGIELVLDRENLDPAPGQAQYVVERMRERGILTSTDGLHHNVIKIKPPLVFSEADCDRFVGLLDEVLFEDAAQPGRPDR